MKKSHVASLFAMLALIPCQHVLAQQTVPGGQPPLSLGQAIQPNAEIQASVMQCIMQVSGSPKDAQAMASLVTALKETIKAQGLGNVGSIASMVVANASDAEGAKALSDAVMTAALLVGVDSNADLSQIASNVGAGIVSGTSDSFQASAVEGASQAISTNLSAEQASTVTQAMETSVANTTASESPSGSGSANPGTSTQPTSDEKGGSSEIIVPDNGDAGDTPSVDISTGSGVAN